MSNTAYKQKNISSCVDKKHFIICQNNIEFMKNLADESINLIITSPPYNIGKAYESKISLDQYVEEQKKVISECARILALDGSICWQVGNNVQNSEVYPLDIMLYPIFKKLGLQLRNRIIWHFGHGLHCTKRLSGRYETILWFTKTNYYYFNLDPIRIPSKYPNKKYFKGPNKGKISGNPLGKNPSDVWEIPNVKNNHIEKTIHPCQFPVGLVERLVLSMTTEKQIVFDPYMGVGSSLIAAIKNNRIGYGCDISEEYVAIAEERINLLYQGRLSTRPMFKAIYDPKLPHGGHDR